MTAKISPQPTTPVHGVQATESGANAFAEALDTIESFTGKETTEEQRTQLAELLAPAYTVEGSGDVLDANDLKDYQDWLAARKDTSAGRPFDEIFGEIKERIAKNSETRNRSRRKWHHQLVSKVKELSETEGDHLYTEGTMRIFKTLVRMEQHSDFSFEQLGEALLSFLPAARQVEVSEGQKKNKRAFLTIDADGAVDLLIQMVERLKSSADSLTFSEAQKVYKEVFEAESGSSEQAIAAIESIVAEAAAYNDGDPSSYEVKNYAQAYVKVRENFPKESQSGFIASWKEALKLTKEGAVLHRNLYNLGWYTERALEIWPEEKPVPTLARALEMVELAGELRARPGFELSKPLRRLADLTKLEGGRVEDAVEQFKAYFGLPSDGSPEAQGVVSAQKKTAAEGKVKLTEAARLQLDQVFAFFEGRLQSSLDGLQRQQVIELLADAYAGVGVLDRKDMRDWLSWTQTRSSEPKPEAFDLLFGELRNVISAGRRARAEARQDWQDTLLEQLKSESGETDTQGAVQALRTLALIEQEGPFSFAELGQSLLELLPLAGMREVREGQGAAKRVFQSPDIDRALKHLIKMSELLKEAKGDTWKRPSADDSLMLEAIAEFKRVAEIPGPEDALIGLAQASPLWSRLQRISQRSGISVADLTEQLSKISALATNEPEKAIELLEISTLGPPSDEALHPDISPLKTMGSTPRMTSKGKEKLEETWQGIAGTAGMSYEEVTEEQKQALAEILAPALGQGTPILDAKDFADYDQWWSEFGRSRSSQAFDVTLGELKATVTRNRAVRAVQDRELFLGLLSHLMGKGDFDSETTALDTESARYALTTMHQLERNSPFKLEDIAQDLKAFSQNVRESKQSSTAEESPITPTDVRLAVELTVDHNERLKSAGRAWHYYSREAYSELIEVEKADLERVKSAAAMVFETAVNMELGDFDGSTFGDIANAYRDLRKALLGDIAPTAKNQKAMQLIWKQLVEAAGTEPDTLMKSVDEIKRVAEVTGGKLAHSTWQLLKQMMTQKDRSFEALHEELANLANKEGKQDVAGAIKQLRLTYNMP